MTGLPNISIDSLLVPIVFTTGKVICSNDKVPLVVEPLQKKVVESDADADAYSILGKGRLLIIVVLCVE